MQWDGLFIGQGQPPPHHYARPLLANWHAHGGAPAFGGGGKPQVMQVRQHVSGEPDIENFDDFVNLPTALSKRIKELQKRARARYGTIQTLEAEKKVLESEKSKHLAIVEELENELSQKSEKIKYYVSEKYRKTIQEPLDQEILRLREEIRRKDAKIEELQRSMHDLSLMKTQHDMFQDKSASLEENLMVLKRGNKQLRQTVSQKSKDITDLLAKLNELRLKIDHNQSRHDFINERLQASIQLSDNDKRHFQELLSTYWNSQSGANSFHVKADLMSFLVKFAHKHTSTPGAASGPPRRSLPPAPRPM
jgi:small-conductance mechanosensitive channel